MEPDGFNNEYANERKPWSRHSRRPAETDGAKGRAEIRGEESEIVQMSARRARAESRLKSAKYHHNLLGSGTTEERKKAHMHPSWWMPEILSLVGGMLCLLGMLHKTAQHLFAVNTDIPKLSLSFCGDVMEDRPLPCQLVLPSTPYSPS